MVSRDALPISVNDLDYDATNKHVRGIQTLERLNASGESVLKRAIPIEFALIERAVFEDRVRRAGFEVAELYGDYQRAPFSAQTSPFMIWSLKKRAV